MKECNKTKLKKFILNQENKMLLIWFCTLVTYVILFLFLKNTFVLLFGYFVFFVIYSKLFNHIENKIKKSLKNKQSNRDLL